MGYSATWHGLFPVYLACAFLFSLVANTLGLAILNLAVINGFSVTSAESILSYLNPIINVVTPFALFFLATRSRVNLSVSYPWVAISILIGAMAGGIPAYVLDLSLSGQGATAYGFYSLVNILSSDLDESLTITFIGFAAILLQYYRSM